MLRLERLRTEQVKENSYFVGVDIGSAYSGYAFASRKESHCDRPRISTSEWKEIKLISLKCPTALLLNEGKEFIAFGYEAENLFSKLFENDEHQDYYYFSSNTDYSCLQRSSKNTVIRDFSGKTLDAFTVNSRMICYLKDHFLFNIRRRMKFNLTNDNVYFVFAVPALWDDQEKQLLKEAAIEAGIEKNKIALVTEPDATSVFIQQLLANSPQGQTLLERIRYGAHYTVIDLGGGTADITCHQNKRDGKIEEIVHRSGGPWGGKSIDEAFYTFLCDICGREVIDKHRSEHLEDWMELFREFESKKRSIRSKQNSQVVISLPASLVILAKQKYKSFQMAIDNSVYKDTVQFAKYKIHIAADTFRGLFNSTITALVDHLRKLRYQRTMDIVLMVGGFAECELVRDAVRICFGQVDLIFPEDAGIAVMKGAVLYGSQYEFTYSHVSIFTYGFEYWVDWDSDKHPVSKQIEICKEKKCKDVFLQLLVKGQRIDPGSEVSTRILVPNLPSSVFDCKFYISTNENPIYTTDPGCTQIGCMQISQPEDQHVEIEVKLIFDDHDILVNARNLNTGEITNKQINYPNVRDIATDSVLSRLSNMFTNDFKDLLSKGDYASYENRIFLAGACNIGKSSLASILIGADIPKTWHSTDGLVIHFGRNGIHLEDKKMIPLDKSDTNLLKKLLLGEPTVEAEEKKSKFDLSASVQNQQLEGTILKPAVKQPFKSALASNSAEKVKDTETAGGGPNKQLKQQSVMSTRGAIPERTMQKIKQQTATDIQSDILKEIRDGTYSIRVAPSDLIDFGGQRSFDMTHQLFIQHKGTFVLMFDGRYGLHIPLKEYPIGNITAKDILVHWVNSILIYCGDSDDVMPMILFAATHSDHFCMDETESKKQQFVSQLTRLFETHTQKKHILYDRVFFIDATNHQDQELELLKDALVDIAFQQPTWGQRMPVAWVPLELQISNLRTKGIYLIAKTEIKELNKLNPEFMLNEFRLEEFLKLQHSLGKIMYFDQPGLKDFIVVQPTAMVNILRSFVTDQIFWPREARLKRILEDMVNTGMVRKKQLFDLWEQPDFQEILPSIQHKDYIVQVLVHLDILVEPKLEGNQCSKSETYLVPCLVKSTIPVEFLQFEEEKTICLAYQLTESSIPSALIFKLIGAAVTIWPLKEVCGRKCLYYQAAIMQIDDNNELFIIITGEKVAIYLSNRSSKCFISPDVAASIQECLTLALERALLFYYKCCGRSIAKLNLRSFFQIEVGVICKTDLCLLPMSKAERDASWTCRKGQSHSTRYCLYWVFNRHTETCEKNCTGLGSKALSLSPTDQHLVRLAKQLDIKESNQFFVCLGLTHNEWEEIDYQYRKDGLLTIKLMAFYQWQRKKETLRLKDLLDALNGIERPHYLCQIVRENPHVCGIADEQLQTTPTEDTLKKLSRQLGPCALELGIELGLTFNRIVDTMYRFYKDLYDQNYEILDKWKQQSKVKPTIHRLVIALQRVDCGGLRFLKSQYK